VAGPERPGFSLVHDIFDCIGRVLHVGSDAANGVRT
jgi:hypothetical protein